MDLKTGIQNFSSKSEQATRAQMASLFKHIVANDEIPENQILENLGLFLSSKNLSRILCFDHLYRQILDVQGVVFDFGTRWGQNMAIFAALRGIYEPFNRHRIIVGFDTFEGFPNITKEDGKSPLMQKGNIAVTEQYFSNNRLHQIMKCQECDNPLSHIDKFCICKGDATKTVPSYLKERPETIISMAYFDFDLFAPTKKCLEAILPRLVKGSLLAFDELNDADSPGETIALIKTIGLNNIRLKRYQYASRISYFVME